MGKTLSLLFVLLFAASSARAQSSDAPVLRSDADELLTIRTATVLPISDNLQGIYARPLETHLIELIKQGHRFDFRAAEMVGPILSPDELQNDKEKRDQLAASLQADAFFVGKVTKGPRGISLLLEMYLTKDRKLFARAEARDLKRFELGPLKEQMADLYRQLIEKIPYRGRVLSRQGNRVTVNLGAKDGVSPDRFVDVIQVSKILRHPKFDFIVNAEKEIIGKIKILKVDDTLSFGMIVSEKERGAIQKNSKVGALDFVSYEDPQGLSAESGLTGPTSINKDNLIAFGENAKAWKPKPQPSFGQVSARLGIGQLQENMQLKTTGSLSATDSFYPSLILQGEIWLTPNYTVHAGLRQGIIAISNPLSGSTPDKLSQSLTETEILFGYNFRISPSVWGPRVEVLAGYSLYQLYVDDSNPQAFTTMRYSGVKLGIDGSFPVDDAGQWSLGAKLFLFVSPSLSESPTSSSDGQASNINQFAIYGFKKVSDNLKVIGQIDFELYSTNFSGNGGTRTDPATSASQRHTTFSAGVGYLF